MFLQIWPGMAKEFGVEVKTGEPQDFADSTLGWEPFPDSAEALAYLKQHYRLFTLTTGSSKLANKMAEKLGSPFTKVFTAEDVGYSKPDKRAFTTQLAKVAEQYGIQKADVLWVAQSQFHDIHPAQQLGLTTVWIERRHNQKGYGGTPIPDAGSATPDFHATSLKDFASQVKKARGE